MSGGASVSAAQLRPLVDMVFDKWTALRLAVDHGMGGGAESAAEMAAWVAEWAAARAPDALDEHELSELLEELLDEELDTVCEDDSPREVAALVVSAARLAAQGQLAEAEARLGAVPSSQPALSRAVAQPAPPPHTVDDSSSQSEPEQDDGWTVVRSRKKN